LVKINFNCSKNIKIFSIFEKIKNEILKILLCSTKKKMNIHMNIFIYINIWYSIIFRLKLGVIIIIYYNIKKIIYWFFLFIYWFINNYIKILQMEYMLFLIINYINQ